MTTIDKQFGPFPFAHRQPNHDGHCRFVHGHNWTFTVTFGADTLDENGFVVDFGKMKPVKEVLVDLFDHTLVVNAADPEMEYFQEMEKKRLCDLTAIPSRYNGSAEGLAAWVFNIIDTWVKNHTERRAFVVQVVCHEDEKNSAIYKE